MKKLLAVLMLFSLTLLTASTYAGIDSSPGTEQVTIVKNDVLTADYSIAVVTFNQSIVCEEDCLVAGNSIPVPGDGSNLGYTVSRTKTKSKANRIRDKDRIQ